MVEQTIAEFGRLDAAFNNAGVMPKNAPTLTALEEFDRVIGRQPAEGLELPTRCGARSAHGKCASFRSCDQEDVIERILRHLGL
jgi:NAD(P)-dependent dehydrogenase (short-subunit alcohol dehydrogenase family)